MIYFMSQIFNYVSYAKPTLGMQVLHDLYGQLSHRHVCIFSLNIDREGDRLFSWNEIPV